MREELKNVVAGNSQAAPGGRGGLPDPAAFDEEGDEQYAAWEQQQQAEMMHEQDEALNGVFRTVGNLREQADVMGRELEEQGEMLGDVDGVADRVGGKLTGGMKRLNHIVRQNEGNAS